MAMVGTLNGSLDLTIMMIYSHQSIHDICYEPEVLLGGLTWRHKQYSCVGAQRPVVALSRAIDPFEGLLVQ